MAAPKPEAKVEGPPPRPAPTPVVADDGPVTLTVRGEGGAEFEMDVPPAGTPRREIFDEHRRKGWLTVLAGDAPRLPPDPAAVGPAVQTGPAQT